MKFEDLKGMTSSDQTGAFLYILARGNRYIMVIEDNDASPILGTEIKSRKKEHLIEQFITMYNTLKKAGLVPVLHHIDNEFSTDLIDEIEGRR